MENLTLGHDCDDTTHSSDASSHFPGDINPNYSRVMLNREVDRALATHWYDGLGDDIVDGLVDIFRTIGIAAHEIGNFLRSI